MKNRKIIFIIVFAVLILLLIFTQMLVVKHSKSVPKEISSLLEKSTLQSIVLYNSFMFTMTNDGVNLEGLCKTVFERYDIDS